MNLMEELAKYVKVSGTFAKGIASLRKAEYDLTFVRESDGKWYIDMPWHGEHKNLEMIAGSDDLLTFLDTEKQNKVRIQVIPSEKPLELDGYAELKQTWWKLLNGATYQVYGIEGFEKEIYLCPVTLCVLGSYPTYLYIKQMRKKTDRNMQVKDS